MVFIVKPFPLCNCVCKYCCSPGDKNNDYIEKNHWLEIFSKRIHEYIYSNNNCTIIWHGYEPLMLGKDFFYNVKKKLKDSNFEKEKITHLIQTNLILLDNEWIEILTQITDGRIGVSADPIENIRILKNGNSSWPYFVDKYLLLKQKNINPSFLYVLHKKSLSKIEELIWIFKNIGIEDLSINPIYKVGNAKHMCNDLLISVNEYSDFLDKLFLLYYDFRKYIKINPIEDWIKIKKSKNVFQKQINLPCSYGYGCGTNFMGVDEKLDVYPCGKFADMKIFKLGNLVNNNIDELKINLWKTKLYKRQMNLIETECKGCQSIEYCHGGCAADAYAYYYDAFRKTIWCDANKSIHKRLSWV
jgi:uncharacterized protein